MYLIINFDNTVLYSVRQRMYLYENGKQNIFNGNIQK